MNILIVDDHAVIHQGLRRILDDEFERVTFGEARHSQAALDLVDREHWDVVILDIDLPGRGGLDLLKQIRADRPNLPMIIFSMHSEEQFAIRALKGGASGYVAKDSDSTQLVEAIRKAIGGGRYVSPALAERLAADLSRDLSLEPHEILSDREFEVMRLIAAGKTTTAIADQLSLSVKTVSTYRTRILEKLQLETTSELIRYAVDRKLDR
jgi:two-component system invasion response regulator UvrY